MASELRLVLVTPEKTLLDEPVASLRFPLFDGQVGVLPGRAPMVGRLGYGELNITGTDGSTRSFFIDGGFVQIKGPVVSILTDRSMSIDEIDATAARQQLDEALSIRAVTDDDFAAKDRELQRTRQMVSLAKKPR